MSAPVILIEVSPRRVADGVAETVRLAGGGAQVPYRYGGYSDWRAGVAGLPTAIASLEFEGGEFPDGSVPSALEIEWAPARSADLAALAAYMWIDAAITVRIGPEGQAMPPIVQSGLVLDASVVGGRLKIALADPATTLKKPLLTARYAGTGGLEGPAEWEGAIRRRVWGQVWNLRADPIDKAHNIYCLADPARPIQSIDAVRDKGAGAASLTTLAWQGSAAATFTALQAASAPSGGGVVCPSIACIKWWTQPAGDLCADLKGEVGGVYVETTAAIAQGLVNAIGGPAFAAGTIAAAIAARPAVIGWVADDDSTTVATMLDELLGNSSLLWLLSGAGEIVIRPWEWGASVASAVSHDVSRKKVLRPIATRKLGYKRNQLKMQRGDLAAIVTYNDGTAIDALKPAAAGADVTGSNIAAGIVGQAPTATNSDFSAVSGTTKPADNAGTTLRLYDRHGGVYTITGNSVKKSASGGAWNYTAYSYDTFTGACVASFTLDTINTFAGIADGTEDSASYGAIDYAVQRTNTNTYRVVNGGTVVLDMGAAYNGVTFSAAIAWTVAYDGLTIKYRADGVLMHTVTTTANRTFRFGCAGFNVNDKISNIALMAAPEKVWANVGGTGKPADNATVGAQLGTNLKNSAATVTLGDGDVITNQGIAAGIVGQGAGATANSLAQLNAADNLNLGNALLSGGYPAKNANANFVKWTSASSAPDGWGNSYGSTAWATRVSTPSGYLYDVTVPASSNHEIYQNMPNIVGQGYFTIEAEVEFVSGNWHGSGVRFIWYTTGFATILGSVTVQFEADPDINGNVLGATPSPGRYYFKKTFYIPHSAAKDAFIGFSGAGLLTAPPSVATRVKGYLCAFRPATDGEIVGLTLRPAEAGANVTGSHTAAAIAGQAATATSSDFSAITGATKPQDNADVTATAQVSVEAVTTRTINADYTGTIASGVLPATVAQPKVVKGGSTITTANNVSYALQNAAGGCVSNVTVDNTTGSSTKGVVTIGTGFNASGSYELVVTVDGYAYPETKVTVSKLNGDPPSGGGGSTSGSFDPNSISINSASYMEVGRVSNLTVASGKTVYGYLAGDYYVDATANASRTMSAKWQYSVAGANSWTDFAAAATGTTASLVYGTYDQTPGSITCNQTKSGLSAGNYDIRLVAIESATTNSSALSFDGAASASVNVT